MKHLELKGFEKKFAEFGLKFNQAVAELAELKIIPKMIETSIPLLTHFQISEALRSTLSDISPIKVRDWEVSKLEELILFINKYQTQKPNLNALAMRLKLISRYVYTNLNGMVNFQFGKDYRPEMPKDQVNTLSKMDQFMISEQVRNFTEDSIMENLIDKLKDIQKNKTWSNYEVGNGFAELLIKEPQVIYMQPEVRDDDDSSDDNDYEEYDRKKNKNKATADADDDSDTDGDSDEPNQPIEPSKFT